MINTDSGSEASSPRLLIRSGAAASERIAFGNMRVREIFQAQAAGFESSLALILLNRIPPGGANDWHVHEDIEKVYYFIRGDGEVACGPWTDQVHAGDFLFFPAAIPHMLRNSGTEDLEFLVCQARTLGRPRGLPEEEGSTPGA